MTHNRVPAAQEGESFYHAPTPDDDVTTMEAQFDDACTDVVLVDRTSAGRILAEGTDALDLLHRMSTNALVAAKPWEVVNTVFTTDKGRIIDYVHVLVQPSSLLLLTSPGSEATVARWIEKFTIMEDVRLSVRTPSTIMVTLLGPKAPGIAEGILGLSLPPGTFITKKLPFGTAAFCHRRDFGTTFIDIIADASDGEHLIPFLFHTSSGLRRMNRAAYETFRISRGIPALGHELSESFNPYEAGLLHAISFTKGCYIGQEVIARLDTYQKVQRTTMGLEYAGSLPPLSQGDTILAGHSEVGIVTSCGDAIIRGNRFAIGILKKSAVQADDHVSIVSGAAEIPANVRSFPLG